MGRSSSALVLRSIQPHLLYSPLVSGGIDEDEYLSFKPLEEFDPFSPANNPNYPNFPPSLIANNLNKPEHPKKADNLSKFEADTMPGDDPNDLHHSNGCGDRENLRGMNTYISSNNPHLDSLTNPNHLLSSRIQLKPIPPSINNANNPNTPKRASTSSSNNLKNLCNANNASNNPSCGPIFRSGNPNNPNTLNNLNLDGMNSRSFANPRERGNN